jgi:hypothetical protein
MAGSPIKNLFQTFLNYLHDVQPLQKGYIILQSTIILLRSIQALK